MSSCHHSLLDALMRATSPRSVLEVVGCGTSRAETIFAAAELHAQPVSVQIICDSKTSIPYELSQRFGNRFRYRTALTLNALAALEGTPDLVILGGDPNWYTVHQSLRLLARVSGDTPFPVTLVYNTGWPYGRRDCYPRPDAIGPGYLLPYARLGIRPDSSELALDGLYRSSNNARLENTDRNGVRTAVEDFQREYGGTLKIVHFPGCHGVSLIVDDRDLAANDKLAALAKDLSISPVLLALIEELEKARVNSELGSMSLETELKRRVAECEELKGQVGELRMTHEMAQRELEDARIAHLESVELTGAKAGLEQLVIRLESELREARGRIAELEAVRAHFETGQNQLRERERAIIELEAQLSALRRREEKRSRAVAPDANDKVARKHEANGHPNGQNGVHGRASKSGNSNSPAAIFTIGTTPPFLDAAAWELANRRLAKLRRDPKLFFAHSRFEIARKFSRFL